MQQNFVYQKKGCFKAHLFWPSLYINNTIVNKEDNTIKKARNNKQEILNKLKDIVNEKNIGIYKKNKFCG